MNRRSGILRDFPEFMKRQEKRRNITMKIVVINGQNHKGSTWHIGNLLTNSFSSEKEITEFFLPRDLNHFCLGCYSCMKDYLFVPFMKRRKLLPML